MIALQEVENEAVLRTLVRKHLRDMGYRYVLVEPTNSRYGLHLGVLSRKPIVTVTSHRLIDLPTPPHLVRRFARDLLQVCIQVSPANMLDLFVAHFKSQYDSSQDPGSEQWRCAEATATWHRIRQTLHGDVGPQWVIVAGDLNDTPQSQVLQILLQDSKTGFPLLIDLHRHLPRSKRITYLRKRHRHTLDYLLASPSLARRVVAESAKVLTYPGLSNASDHAPVVATFHLKREKR